MTTAAAFLWILWIGSHLAIVLTIRDSKFRLPVFAIIGFSLLVAYAMKPYTYDLPRVFNLTSILDMLKRTVGTLLATKLNSI